MTTLLPTLVGSRALNFWRGQPSKDTTDWDVISEQPIPGCEWHEPDNLNNRQMAVDYNSFETVLHPSGVQLYIMQPMGLAIMKRSHLWRDLSFQKHITMYHRGGLSDWLKPALASGKFPLIEADLAERTKLTHTTYPQKNPNLMQLKDDFFNDAVKKKYDHDFLHTVVAYEDAPIYTKMLRTANLAWCDLDKWLLLTKQQQLYAVAEEAMVIAIERFLVPKQWNFPPKLAYMNAVQKICTTLCSGWFRDFAIDEYPAVIDLYDPVKFGKFKQLLP